MATPVSGSYYNIMNLGTTTFLQPGSIPGDECMANKPLLAGRSHPQWAWYATALPNGYWTFRAFNYAHVAFDTAGPFQRLKVIQWDDSDPYQWWTVQAVQNSQLPTFFTITNVATGMNIDLDGGSTAPNAIVVSQTPDTNPNQQWIFIACNGDLGPGH